MNLILPYEKKLYNSTGAFIKQNGNILYVNKSHEAFANNYCQNNLEKKELLLYKKWLEISKKTNHLSIDFLVFMLSYDKVETIVKKVITTTSYIPHIRFYNYLLMGWRLNIYPKLTYDKENNQLVYKNNTEYIYHSGDREKEEELHEILTKVPLEDRHYFLK